MPPGVLCIPRVGHRPDESASWLAAVEPSASRFRSGVSVSFSEIRFRDLPGFQFCVDADRRGGQPVPRSGVNRCGLLHFPASRFAAR